MADKPPAKKAATTKPPGKVYKLADVIRDVEEKRHRITIETDNGETFTLDPPELWDDAVFEASQEGPVAEARAIMGDEEYARFRKAGGRATLIQAIVQQHVGSVKPGE